jgi:hypothetical protein
VPETCADGTAIHFSKSAIYIADSPLRVVPIRDSEDLIAGATDETLGDKSVT